MSQFFFKLCKMPPKDKEEGTDTKKQWKLLTKKGGNIVPNVNEWPHFWHIINIFFGGINSPPQKILLAPSLS